jgi:hypothetical protein
MVHDRVVIGSLVFTKLLLEFVDDPREGVVRPPLDLRQHLLGRHPLLDLCQPLVVRAYHLNLITIFIQH